MKRWTTQWLGYIFCEFSFRWFDLFDVPADDSIWRWYHHWSSFIGGAAYSAGCCLYGFFEQEGE